MKNLRKLLMFLSCFIIFSSVVGAVFIGYMDYLVHGALGIYGVMAEQTEYGVARGTNDRLWYHGFDIFESSVHEWMIVSILFGIVIGSLGTFGILKLRNKKTESRNDVTIADL